MKSGDECVSAKSSKISRRRDARSIVVSDRLLSRLKRCEELLQAHGVTIEDDPAIDHTESTQHAPVPASKTDDGQMIVEHGYSRYVENNLWRGLKDELQNPDDLPETSEEDTSQPTGELHAMGESLILGRGTVPSLYAIHPTVPQIFGLWQICLDNINPLVKLFHAPSVQQMILEAATDLYNIPKSTEALMFAIYFSSVNSMNEQDCQKMMGESKSALLARFSNATQQALVNAEFMKSANLVVLQALTLYLLAGRQLFDTQSLWLLTGLASRIGRIIGLHREDSMKKLSAFEKEIRRRLWWQIVIMDSRSAQLLGAVIDANFHHFWDTKRPLNVNDSDLFPSMRELPIEHDGVSEMLFCSLRFEIGESMRTAKHSGKDKQAGGNPIAQQDRAIDELERRLEQRFLTKCDSSIPFHLLATYVGRSAICQMRLSVHHPRHHPDKGARLASDEKDRLFALALQIIVYDNLAHSTKSIEGYLWHIATYFAFEAFIFVLTELLTRAQGEAVDRAWMQVNQVYEDHSKFINETSNALYRAMANLTLKAWDNRVATARTLQPPYQPVEPASISKLRAQRRGKSSASTQQRSQAQAVSPQPQTSSHGYHAVEMADDLNLSLQLATQPHFLGDSPDLDWECWQNLLDGRADPFLDGHEQHSW